MLSRTTANMPKFNSFLRQISKNVAYSKQLNQLDAAASDSTDPINSNSNSSSKNESNQQSIKKISQETKANINQMFKNINQNNNSSNNLNNNQRFNNYRKQNNNNNFNRYDNSNKLNINKNNNDNNKKYDSNQQSQTTIAKNDQNTDMSSVLNTLPQKISEEYLKIISCFQNDSIQINDLILLCQKLIELFDSEPILIDHFKAQAAKSILVSKLSSNLDNLSDRVDDLISILKFALRIDLKVNRLEPMIDARAKSLNGDQLVQLISLFRNANVNLPNKYNISLKYSNYFLKSDHQGIESFSNILTAMKLFARNAEVISSLDQKILRLSEQLNIKNWIDLLNIKSILRLRDINILQACAYQLIALDKDQNKLKIENIQQALLSCGILSFLDEKFQAYLLGCLNNALKKPDLLKSKADTEKYLNSIISSIGILHIRDKNILNNLSKYLLVNFSQSSKLLTNFVITCGHLNYNPNSEDFKQIVAHLNSSKHDLEDNKDKITFLNYVWSTCLLKCPNVSFISLVLDELNFYGTLQSESNLKSIILKLFNINLYTMLFMENYTGPQLSNKMSAQNYKHILMPESSSLNKLFLATLASFRPVDKYFKMNLLTSYGILIDALMVCDKNGNPQLISEKFDQNMKLNVKDDEYVVAFKLIGFKDHTHIEKVPNGPASFQLSLLDELGYNSITITHEELNGEKTILNRVKLLKDKIKAVVERAKVE